MTIILDAMGGDNAPDAAIKGAIKAAKEIESDILLVGDKEIILERIKALYGADAVDNLSNKIKIKHASQSIEMEDIPTEAIKHKKDSSMVVRI